MTSNHTCSFPKCRNEYILTWLTKQLCQKHWEYVCAHRKEAEEKLGIKIDKTLEKPKEPSEN